VTVRARAGSYDIGKKSIAAAARLRWTDLDKSRPEGEKERERKGRKKSAPEK